MTIRFARHTTDLEKIKSFYLEVLGLELLGRFENHDGYDGLFIGKPCLDWHLEFTTSAETPQHTFDEDDLLVLYPKTMAEYNALVTRLQENHIPTIPSKNPYWNTNGLQFLDPDGYRILISNLKT